jgi:hypothetical protein
MVCLPAVQGWCAVQEGKCWGKRLWQGARGEQSIHYASIHYALKYPETTCRAMFNLPARPALARGRGRGEEAVHPRGTPDEEKAL